MRSGRPAAPNAIALGSCTSPDLIRVTQPYSWSVPISRSTFSPAARTDVGPGRPQRVGEARTWAAVPPAPVFSHVAHQDHAAEVVVGDQLGRLLGRSRTARPRASAPGRPGRRRRAWRPRAAARSRARVRGRRESWRSAGSGLTVTRGEPAATSSAATASRRAAASGRRAGGWRAPVHLHTRTPAMPNRQRQLTWVSRVAGAPSPACRYGSSSASQAVPSSRSRAWAMASLPRAVASTLRT